jgi:hypothetical protein
MRKAPLLVAFSLLAASAAAQTQKPAPTEQRPEATAPAPAPAPRLNLKLDDAARYTREVPVSKGGGENLPGLGEGASPMERPTRDLRPDFSSTFPKDTNPGK